MAGSGQQTLLWLPWNLEMNLLLRPRVARVVHSLVESVGISRYDNWVKRNVPDPLGKCGTYSRLMKQQFPELTLIRGHYLCPLWGQREHWWLVASDGSIVDPTYQQFPSKGEGDYIPLDESAPEPNGKCMNCGEYYFGSDPYCSRACKEEIIRYYRVPIR